MARFWIRVNAKLANDPQVIAFALVILPRQPVWLSVRAACGLLGALWGCVVDEQEDGNLSGRADDILEAWAGWGGKRGLFAKEFRAHFVDADGSIREWADYQGKLIERREYDRERKRRDKSPKVPPPIPEVSAGIPQEVDRSSRCNENGNDQAFALAPTEQESKSPAPDVGVAPEGAASPARDYLDNPATREQLKRRTHVPEGRVGPVLHVSEAAAASQSWADRYSEHLAQYCERWFAKHPNERPRIEAKARDAIGAPPGVEIPERLLEMHRSAVCAALALELELAPASEWIAKKQREEEAAA